jgi:hypothetical protein
MLTTSLNRMTLLLNRRRGDQEAEHQRLRLRRLAKQAGRDENVSKKHESVAIL